MHDKSPPGGAGPWASGCPGTSRARVAARRRATRVPRRPAGSVATLRDSTELRALSGRAETAR
ncbi:hypothetical protein ACGFS9_18230, partial [Streptomyces sp. NPDC048566]|uniref:hypothetical protein n=1 Tax=Streptomyces sp. NPDC048566 TaxID=3365569 RepID=UPI003721AE44